MHRNVLAIFLSAFFSVNMPFKEFQKLIPNGDRIPNPCHSGSLWHGVGHVNKMGGGRLNQFGVDFLRLGKKWNNMLCLLDSDGDGRSNGEELGDPNCTWSNSLKSKKDSMKISHPGICEPINSFSCQEINFQPCNDQCPALQEKETMNITIKFPPTRVPQQVTTYMCLLFQFPQDGDYHIVATKPAIDNHHVMHHILLFGCDESDGEVDQKMYTPFVCGMIAHPKCSSVIGIWSLGISGECSHNQSGFRIGTKGFRKGALQIHWNNPRLMKGLTDGSGMTIYYTPKLRPYDAGIMIVGQYWIDLLPRKRSVDVTAECSSECSNKLIYDEIYIASVYNHMHYLGKKERIELFRNNTKITDLAYDKNYSYDFPVLHSFETPIKILPGDSIMTTCVYSTVTRSENVRFGDSTSDEMCLGFLTYFPKGNLKDSYCTNWKSIPLCLLWERNADTIINGCYIQRFLQGRDTTANPIIQNIIQACTPLKTCSEWCRYSVNLARLHPCFHGDVLDFIGYESKNDFPEFLIPFIICDIKKKSDFSAEIILDSPKASIDKPQNNTCERFVISFFDLLIFQLFLSYFQINNM